VSNPGNEPFEYEKKVICVHASELALKVTPIHPHKPTPFWVPKEAVHDDSEVYAKGHEGKLVTKTWFAVNQGWTHGDSD
jgi:hypothetical protein